MRKKFGRRKRDRDGGSEVEESKVEKGFLDLDFLLNTLNCSKKEENCSWKKASEREKG